MATVIPQHETQTTPASLNHSDAQLKELFGIEEIGFLQKSVEALDLEATRLKSEIQDGIETLKKSGVTFTPEEEADLRTGQETYDAVSAWERVMQVAKGCVLS